MRYRLPTMGLVLGLLLTASWAAPAPSVLAAEEPREESPGELAREGVESLLRALNAFIEMIPQYEMPELTKDGDIIIRRKRKPDEAKPESPELDETRT